MRRKRRSAEQWAAEVESWRGSGLSAKEYAQRKGLSLQRLQWWGRRVDARSPRLVALEASDQGEPLWEVQRPGGVRLLVYRELAPALAKNLVSAVIRGSSR
jgi:hypothetical protein